MEYIHKVTGASINIPCVLNSDIWELAEKPAPVIEEKDEKPVKKVEKKTSKK